MGSWTSRSAAFVLVALIGLVSPAIAEDTAATLRQNIYESLRHEDHQRADRLIAQYLVHSPDDGAMIYNAACVACGVGDFERAERHLLGALKAGFQNFSLMRRDPDLSPLRRRGMYRTIMAARAAAEPMLAERRVEEWTKQFGADAYRFDRDETRRIDYVTALSEGDTDRLKTAVARQSRLLERALFEGSPSEWFLLVVPTARDAARLFADPHAHGHYHHGRRRLIATDIDRSLRHELTHVFHHADMDRRAQQHPMWVQEGLACLFEACLSGDDGAVEFAPNDRDARAVGLARENQLLPLRDLLDLSDGGFRDRSRIVYAQSRSLFRFLADSGRLGAWYRRYTERFHEDPSGAAALESVFAASLADIEARWRDWIAGQSAADLDVRITAAASRLVEPELDREPQIVIDAPPAPPTPAELAYREARGTYETGQYDQAAAAFRDVLELDPQHAAAHYDLGLCYVRTRRYAAAHDHLHRLVTLDPSLASLLANLLRPR